MTIDNPIYFIEISTGNYYQGVCQPGDREATEEETVEIIKKESVVAEINRIHSRLKEIDELVSTYTRDGNTDALHAVVLERVDLEELLLTLIPQT